MGVWIETALGASRLSAIVVTPCMGVWIETKRIGHLEKRRSVTPCMGVWIETSNACLNICLIQSHPVWVCGLKQTYKVYGI